MPQPEIIRQAITSRLSEHGWEPISNGTAIARKFYETAVGMKEALAYLYPGADYFTLKGDYQSEGRNVLEAHGALIPRGADEQEAIEKTDAFAADADRYVGESYAARLVRKRVAPGL